MTKSYFIIAPTDGAGLRNNPANTKEGGVGYGQKYL